MGKKGWWCWGEQKGLEARTRLDLFMALKSSKSMLVSLGEKLQSSKRVTRSTHTFTFGFP